MNKVSINEDYKYRRRSSEDSKQIASIEDQDTEINKILKYRKIAIPKKNDYEESKTARVPGRERFNEMMNRIEKGANATVYVWNADRLARNGQDAGRIIQALSDGKIKKIVTPQFTYTAGGTDTMLLYIHFGISDKYSKDLSKVVKRGMYSKIRRGWWCSNPKTGYLNEEKDNEVIQVKDLIRFPQLRKAIEYYLNEKGSIQKTLDYLNDELGFRTRKTKKIGGKPMVKSKLYKILKDPYYYGKLVWGGIEVEAHKDLPRLMTEDEYWKIQELLGRRGVPRPRKYFDLPYRGLFKCGVCGGEVIPYVKKKKLKSGEVKEYFYIKCTRNKGRKNCHQPQITFVNFETQVMDILSSITISESFHDWAIKWLNNAHEKESREQQTILNAHTNNLAKVLGDKNGLVKAYSSGDIDSDEFKTAKKDYDEQKAKIEREITILNSRTENWIEQAKNTIDFARTAHSRFEKGVTEDKMEVIRALGSNFVMQDKKLYIDLLKPYLVFKKNYSAIHLEECRVEPEEVLVGATKKGLPQPQNSTWWGGWESNPHSRFFRPVP